MCWIRASACSLSRRSRNASTGRGPASVSSRPARSSTGTGPAGGGQQGGDGALPGLRDQPGRRRRTGDGGPFQQGAERQAGRRLAEHLGQAAVAIGDPQILGEDGDALEAGLGQVAQPGRRRVAGRGAQPGADRHHRRPDQHGGRGGAADDHRQPLAVERRPRQGHAAIRPELHGGHAGEVQAQHGEREQPRRQGAGRPAGPGGQRHGHGTQRRGGEEGGEDQRRVEDEAAGQAQGGHAEIMHPADAEPDDQATDQGLGDRAGEAEAEAEHRRHDHQDE